MRLHGNGNEIDMRKIAIPGAFCLFLSTIEYLIPKPMPFMRLGLANLPLLLALEMPPSYVALLCLVKIFGQSLISGTLFSYIFLFSASGTIFSCALMYVIRRFVPQKMISFVGISMAGAFTSNMIQIVLARFFIFGKSAIFIAPPFLAMGLVTGAALGFFCTKFTACSVWYKKHFRSGYDEIAIMEKKTIGVETSDKTGKKTPRQTKKNRKKFMLFSTKEFYPIDLFIAGVIMILLLLFNHSTAGRLLLFALYFIYAFCTGKSGSIFSVLLFFTIIVFFNLLNPFGKVLFSLGSFRITEGALESGLRKAATVEALIMMSRFSISNALNIPGKFGSLLNESFKILFVINENKNRITAKNFISDIDALLLELNDRTHQNTDIKTKRTVKYTILLLLPVLLSLTVFLLF
ncbi:membrane protein [Spirochaetia bacterium]|nr:membrane protein [Spirochaetia bacterium]